MSAKKRLLLSEGSSGLDLAVKRCDLTLFLHNRVEMIVYISDAKTLVWSAGLFSSSRCYPVAKPIPAVDVSSQGAGRWCNSGRRLMYPDKSPVQPECR